MKNLLKLFFLFFISFSTIEMSAQEHNQTDAKGLKQGYWVKTTPDGVKVYEGTFKDDKPIGLMKRYYEDGGLKAEMIYREDGNAYAYLYYQGKTVKMAEGKYRGQAKDSTWLSYDFQGKLAGRDSYVNGLLHGKSVVYLLNGSVSEEITYEKGKRNGPWTQYYQNGKVMANANYVNDLMVGEFVKNYLNGREWIRGKYNDKGLKESTWIYGNEDGSIGQMVVYRDGKEIKVVLMNGVFTDYFEAEKPQYKTTYKDGKKNGEYLEYYNNGKWVDKEVDKRREGGEVETYSVLEGQSIKRKGQYKDDKLEGKMTYFYENGTIEKVEEYKEGELIN
jgi:antitoxin component YwqK of YwqJK toxin-antitoxin module